MLIVNRKTYYINYKNYSNTKKIDDNVVNSCDASNKNKIIEAVNLKNVDDVLKRLKEIKTNNLLNINIRNVDQSKTFKFNTIDYSVVDEESLKLFNAIIDPAEFSKFDILEDIKNRPGFDFDKFTGFMFFNAINGAIINIRPNSYKNEVCLSFKQKACENFNNYYFIMNNVFFKKLQTTILDCGYYFVLRPYTIYNFNQVNFKLLSYNTPIPHCENFRRDHSFIVVLCDQNYSNTNDSIPTIFGNIFIVLIRPKTIFNVSFTKTCLQNQSDKSFLEPNFLPISYEYTYCPLKRDIVVFRLLRQSDVDKIIKFAQKQIHKKVSILDYNIDNISKCAANIAIPIMI